MAEKDTNTEVSCYSGYIYAQEPRCFLWQGKKITIESVQAAWREPGNRLFRVVTEDGKLFELCYNEADDCWSAKELVS